MVSRASHCMRLYHTALAYSASTSVANIYIVHLCSAVIALGVITVPNINEYMLHLSQTTASSEEGVRSDLESLLDQYFSPTITNEQRLKLSTSEIWPVCTVCVHLVVLLTFSYLISTYLLSVSLESLR